MHTLRRYVYLIDLAVFKRILRFFVLNTFIYLVDFAANRCILWLAIINSESDLFTVSIN